MIVLPALSSVNDILDTDLILVEHSTGEGFKMTGADLKDFIKDQAVGLLKKYSYTKQSDSSTISGNGYTEIEIPQNLLPTSVQGYTLVGNQIGQTDYLDAFLFNLHIRSNNNWSITVYNCASSVQTVPDIQITLLFMKNT